VSKKGFPITGGTYGAGLGIESSAAGISLDLALTSRCPLSCRYCTVEKKRARELGAEEWAEIIGSFARLRTIEAISLEGGEPFSRGDLTQILASALQHARRVKIVTGGGVLSCLPASLVSDPRFSFEVSLDGPPTIHNFLRDQSYDRAIRFLGECLRAGIRVRFRTVISRHNMTFYEPWLEELDRTCEGGKEKIGFFFDTIIPPRSLSGPSGSMGRAPLRDFPVHFLVPSPLEVRGLFARVKGRMFRNLFFQQDEPIRGCRPVESPFLSFDPAGVYSLCCESPGGLGSIAAQSPEVCLSRLDQAFQDLPCHACPCYGAEICLGCWSGQKCGMVGHWAFTHCRELADIAGKRSFPPRPPRHSQGPLP